MINTRVIEKKWQKRWEEEGVFTAKNNSDKKKYYILVEFPYPSGAGLHVGHVRSYTALDAMARLKRAQGYNVLYPIGWDAFGAPAEQYAIKNHVYPSKMVSECIDNFKHQIKALGISFDWSREINTSSPEYYKWTQWQFLQFYKAGLAYKAEKDINWCPNCKMGLSNEDAAGGVCERCGSKVEKKLKNQWMLKMTAYADSLIEGLKDTDFMEKIKTAQINWIGKSVGAEVDFKLKDTEDMLKVFTTRCDTLYGVTFMVMSPEHPFLEKYQDRIKNIDELKAYQDAARVKSEIERTDESKEKTGIKLDGLEAVNPVSGEVIPIYVSDYVLAGYGTGAIMAVPAHDTRDYAFAKKFGIKIIPVIEGGDISKEAYTGDGVHINSGVLNGLGKEDAINTCLKYLEDNHIGKKTTNYRLQDWIFSRQRFWGEPIPMIYCEKCGWQPMEEKDLPLLLPNVAEYEPTENGESPLAKIDEWVNTTCPCCGGPARRETDTMPNWAGSSWYFLRFMDPHNNKEFANMDVMKYWNRVDWYDGGMEHTARHLLYARFWVQMLYNFGLVPHKEMIWTRVSHGMILGSNNEKMSKSKGNVINPDEIVNGYGADALRIYEMFMGDYTQDAPWSTDSLKGCKRFVDRIVRLKDKVTDNDEYSKDLEVIINKSIKKVEHDLTHMAYNTAVSTLMILLNAYDEKEHITKGDYRILLELLNPIAPHITEELNETIGYEPICNRPWPKYDEAKTEDQEKEIAIQVNGKVRDTIKININTSKEELEKTALSRENIKKWIENKEVVKVIVVPGRIVNIVIK